MASLDLEIRHRGRKEDTFQASGDPRNAGWLSGELTGWLSAHRWHESRWGEFDLVARPAGKNKPVATVRA